MRRGEAWFRCYHRLKQERDQALSDLAAARADVAELQAEVKRLEASLADLLAERLKLRGAVDEARRVARMLDRECALWEGQYFSGARPVSYCLREEYSWLREEARDADQAGE